MTLSIKKIIIYSFLVLLLISFVQCSISFISNDKIPCHPDDGYCWKGQSDKVQKKYLN